MGHHFENIDYATLKDGPARRKAGTQHLYCQSKYVRPSVGERGWCRSLIFARTLHWEQGNVVFATELARRYGAQGIVSTSLHPGTHPPSSPTHLFLISLSSFRRAEERDPPAHERPLPILPRLSPSR